jgi:hypothetical protein
MTLLDDFNRANGALGASWTALVGTAPYSIISNAAAPDGASNENCVIYNAFTPGNDHWAAATVTAHNVDSFVGVAVRASGTSWYGFYGDTLSRYLFSVVSGSYTVLATTGTGFAVNDVVRIEAEGTTIRALVNGVEWTSVTDSSLASGSAGLVTWSTGNVGRLDDFSAADIGGAAASFILPSRRRAQRVMLTR